MGTSIDLFLQSLLLAIGTVLAQEDTSSTSSSSATIYAIIIVLVVIGLGSGVAYRLFFNKESDCYKCKMLRPGVAVDPMTGDLIDQHEAEVKQADRMHGTVDDMDHSHFITPPEKINQVFDAMPVFEAKETDVHNDEELPRQHIFITYTPDVETGVRMCRERLRQEGYRVWIASERLHAGDTSSFDAISQAIDNAAIVVPVLTGTYQDSDIAKKELQYADRIQKPLVPVRMQKKYRPEGWIGFLLGNTLFHDLSNPDTYEAQIDNFLEALEDRGENAKMLADEFDQIY